nr:methylmalonyl-CoA epimerase [Scopulibacillus daqui]
MKESTFESQNIDHIGIAVKSLEKSIPLYQEILNFEYEGTEELEDQQVRAAFFKTGHSRIELLEPMNHLSPVATFIKKRGEGIHHIALKVENIDERIQQLKAQGIRMIDQKPRIGAKKVTIAFIHPNSTHGVLYELCQQ